MSKRILIAEPREVIRIGLCTIFQKDTSVSEVKSVATHEEFNKHLFSFDFDLVVVSHAFITNMKLLPQGKFVLLIEKPDFNVLMGAYEHQARGYISVNVTADLLIAMLKSTGETFFVDPVFLPWMMEFLIENKKRTSELQLLSPREREVTMLLEDGMDRQTIARQLHISEATLKTHMKNIAHKYADAQWSQEVVVYQRYMKGS